jgi:DNA (cytosine-5)-methyltransferase 1
MKMKLEKKMPISLNDQVAHPQLMWPTPTTRDYKDSGKAVINSHRDSILPVRVAKKDKEQWVKGGGSLNPTWVEWLMGYPKGWTDLNH